MPTTSAYSFHLAVKAYVADAVLWRDHLDNLGFATTVCTGVAATSLALHRWVSDLVSRAEGPRTLVITLSAHGSTESGYREDLRLDVIPTLSDVHVSEALALLPEQDTVFLVVDACHAEGMGDPDKAIRGVGGLAAVMAPTTFQASDMAAFALGNRRPRCRVVELAATNKRGLARANSFDEAALGAFTAQWIEPVASGLTIRQHFDIVADSLVHQSPVMTARYGMSKDALDALPSAFCPQP